MAKKSNKSKAISTQKKDKNLKKRVNATASIPIEDMKGKSTAAKEARQAEFLKNLVANSFNISTACLKTGIVRKTYYLWMDGDQKFREEVDAVFEARVDAWEECLHSNIKSGSEASVIFGLKTQGRARGWHEKEIINGKVVAILDKVLKNELTPRDAAYQISMQGLPLPEALKLELAKIQPEPPPPELPPEVSDADLEARYQAQLRKNQEQVETFVPARQEEVRQLKEELKGIDSFGPDAENKTRGKDDNKDTMEKN